MTTLATHEGIAIKISDPCVLSFAGAAARLTPREALQLGETLVRAAVRAAAREEIATAKERS